LLLELLTDAPLNEKEAILEKIALRLAPDSMTITKNLTQRLTQAVQHLNQLNYQARWEAHADGPRLILGHCPYAAIIDRHPELCRIDSHLLEQLLGQPVTQNAKLMTSPQGSRYCLFVARKD